MRIALYSSSKNPSIGDIKKLLTHMGIDFEINPEATSSFDFAVSFGGDGTFLSSVRKMGRKQIPILGINAGRLGFLSNVANKDAAGALEQLAQGRYTIERRTMIKVATTESMPEWVLPRALNEFSIQKSGTAMVAIEVEVDHQKVGSYWADGIIVSTPTGSTAYSMSVGGAIITPGCRSFIISPIAPHNLNIRPLVIPDSSEVKLKVTTRSGNDAIATVDNREYLVKSGTEFELRRSKYELEVIRLEGSDFYKTIREKLLWGVDPRN